MQYSDTVIRPHMSVAGHSTKSSNDDDGLCMLM